MLSLDGHHPSAREANGSETLRAQLRAKLVTAPAARRSRDARLSGAGGPVSRARGKKVPASGGRRGAHRSRRHDEQRPKSRTRCPDGFPCYECASPCASGGSVAACGALYGGAGVARSLTQPPHVLARARAPRFLPRRGKEPNIHESRTHVSSRFPGKSAGYLSLFPMNITLFRPRRLGPKRRGGNSEGINSVTSPTRPSSTAATRRETKTPPTTLRLWNTPTHLLYSRERRRLLRTLPQHFPQRLIHPRAPARRQLHRLVERVHLPLARDDDLRRLPSG